MAATQTITSMLSAEGLCKSFGGLHAVQNLDFHIEAGEIVAIIGPNGSGKTTFFNLIMQLYDVTDGAIYLGPEKLDIVGLPTHRINALGISRTFQTLRLFTNLTVLENVLVGMNRHLSTSYWSALIRPASKIFTHGTTCRWTSIGTAWSTAMIAPT